jgi:DNA polymerase-3 subunit alpha
VKELGMPAVAMTDHGNIFGAVHFVNAAKEAGVKPIVGCELYVCKKDDHHPRTPPDGDTYNHLLVLAENEEGYRNLVKITSEASLHGFYYKPRVSKKFLAEHSKGLIGLSGCLKGEVAERLMEEKYDAARAAAATYQRHLRQRQFLSRDSGSGPGEGTPHPSQPVPAGKRSRPAPGRHQRQPLSLRGRRPRAGRDALHPDGQVDPRHQPHEVPGQPVLRQEPRRDAARVQGFAGRADPHAGHRRALQPEAGENQNPFPQFEVPAGYTIDSYFEHVTREGFARRLEVLRPLHEQGR